VTSTKPLVLVDGTVVRDLVVRFEAGRATSVEASEGGATLATIIATDAGAARLGEVALVDREGRIGELGTIFYDTLLDENAASHLAVGHGFGFLLDEPDRERCNTSEIHIDFMVGSSELTVTGVTASGDRVPVLVEGRWQI
jgi:aminopeptidase